MHVIVSDEALEDLSEIWNFVAQSSPASADRLLAALVRRCYTLADNPFRFSVVPSMERDQVRRCNLRTWAIFFVSSDTHVDVLHIVHGGRDTNDLF